MKKHLAGIVLVVCALAMGGVKASDLSLIAGIGPTSDLPADLGSIEMDSFTLFGARFEKDLLFFLGLENSLMYTANLLTPNGQEGESGLYYSANLVVNLGASDVIVPNVTLGLGFLNRFGDSFPDVGSTFQTNWGGGIKFRKLAGPAGLRLDYRRLTFYDVGDDSLKAHEISGGLMFSF